MGFRNRFARSISLFGLVLTLVASAAPAFADGTETLGTPSIPVGEGSGTIAAGVGLWNGPGTIDIDVPGEVVQAILYWEGHTAGPTGYDDTIVVDGNTITGTVIGGPTQFFGNTYSTTLRADVTSLGLVDEGVNALAVSGLSFSRGNNGAGLFVIYDDGTNVAEIDLRDGNDLAFHSFDPPLDTTVPQTFTFAAETADRVADLTIFASSVAENGFRPSSVEVLSGVVTVIFDNQLGSNDGAEWDTLIVPVPIAAGATTLTVQVKSVDNLGTGANPASLAWLGAGLSVPVTPPPPPDDDCKDKDKHKWGWGWDKKKDDCDDDCKDYKSSGYSKYKGGKDDCDDDCKDYKSSGYSKWGGKGDDCDDDCKDSKKYSSWWSWDKKKDCDDNHWGKPWKKGKSSWDWGKGFSKKGKWSFSKGKWSWWS